jgi:hypothetical protein
MPCDLISSNSSPLSSPPRKDRVEASVSPGRATTWKEAHRAHCMKRGTLRASIQDVLNETCDDDQDIPWELPRRGTSIISAMEVADQLRQANPAEATRGIETPIKSSWMTRLMRSFIYAAGNDNVESDDDGWVQEHDDAFQGENPDGSTFSAPDLAMPIVNLDMMKRAIEELQAVIRQRATDTSPHILVGRSDWPQWISSAAAEDARGSVLAEMSTADKEFLLQVLEAMQEALIISLKRDTGHADVIVLSPSVLKDQMPQRKNTSQSSLMDSTKDKIPEHLQVHVALWEISKIEQSIEKQIDEWSERVADCNSKALKYKRQNQKSLALNQLAKRNIIQQRIDSSSKALIKLEQSKSAIETAQSNKMVLEHMRASTKVLKDLRLQSPLEEIEAVKDDWQAEYDKLQENHESLSAMGNVAGYVYDDDELLKELENLTSSNVSTCEGNPPPPQPPGKDDEFADLEKRLSKLAGLGNSISDVETCETTSLPTGASRTFQTAL